MRTIHTTITSIILLLVTSNLALAHEHDNALNDLGKNTLPKWVNNSAVTEQIKSQNSKTKDMSEAEIIVLDKQWRAETNSASQPLIEEVLGRPLSAYLAKVKEESQGLYTEIFVMDAKGMNVGQSDVTSDYWQGDEAKWQKTYLEGPSAIHIGDIEMDESSQQFQAQLSLSVVDPASGTVIGAVTVGINLDAL